ncbi:MAG TPA: 5'-methylthioadenosine/S-adenosylhomocysteine nucleosidase [Anaerolineaceae bacterium]|nr:5'-methylthioadenosine/S-adenosylhomocysteine nucleosidase [Anaerolineaceae bacterium]
MIVVLISANAEWRAVRAYYPDLQPEQTPFGEWLETTIHDQPVVLMHGGWGKIAAAGSTQYAIDRWNPALLINLGTCGGLAGAIQRGEIVLVTETLVYDILEQMTDPQAALEHFHTRLDLSWLPKPLPYPVRPAPLFSADRDILASDVPHLRDELGAIACDWESGAIAWIAARNAIPCLILRGVTDLVDEHSGEAYGNVAVFHDGATHVLTTLLNQLPTWLDL